MLNNKAIFSLSRPCELIMLYPCMFCQWICLFVCCVSDSVYELFVENNSVSSMNYV